MSYFDAELKTLLPFVVLGIIIGIISFFLNNTLTSFILMLIVAVLGKIALAKITKIAEGWKWWIGNGIVVYFFMWLVVWTILINSPVIR